MITLTYVSDATSELQSGDVFKIVEASARNNSDRDLTGFLIFANNRFFQVLEGPEAQVNALLAKLGDDKRHDNITILHRTAIEERRFPNWSMKRLVHGDQSSAISQVAQLFPNASAKVQQAAMDFLNSDD